MLALSVTDCEMITVKFAWPWPLDEPRSNINMPIEMPLATSYMLAIAMFTLSVTSLRMNSQMSSIGISDLENEGQGHWRFGWNLVDELTYGN